MKLCTVSESFIISPPAETESIACVTVLRSHSTQNRSFRRSFSQTISWLSTEETKTPHKKASNTRRVAVHLETHCNIGSKRAFPTGVLNRWHNCLRIYWRNVAQLPRPHRFVYFCVMTQQDVHNTRTKWPKLTWKNKVHPWCGQPSDRGWLKNRTQDWAGPVLR